MAVQGVQWDDDPDGGPGPLVPAAPPTGSAAEESVGPGQGSGPAGSGGPAAARSQRARELSGRLCRGRLSQHIRPICRKFHFQTVKR